LPNEFIFPLELLQSLQTELKSKFKFDVKLQVKPLQSNIELSNVSEDELIDDDFAAETLVRLMSGKIKNVHGELFVYDTDTGIWNNNESIILKTIKKFKKELTFKIPLKDGSFKTFDYGGSVSKIKPMLYLVPSKCIDDEFFNRNQDSDKGILLFKNGTYYGRTKEFKPEFNPNVVSKYRIDYNFPERNQDNIDFVM
jgi:hypothetical protein